MHARNIITQQLHSRHRPSSAVELNAARHQAASYSNARVATRTHDTTAPSVSHARTPALLVSSCDIATRAHTHATPAPRPSPIQNSPRYVRCVEAIPHTYKSSGHVHPVQIIRRITRGALRRKRSPTYTYYTPATSAPCKRGTATARPHHPEPAHKTPNYYMFTAADRASVHSHDTPAPHACYGQVPVASPATFPLWPLHKRT